MTSASSSIYGPGLIQYRGPIGNYPAGTRAAYVYPGSYYYYGYPWLLLYGSDDISEYQQSDAGIPIDTNNLPPGCELTNQTAASPNNETLLHAETVSFWMQPVVYNIGNESIACESVDITSGIDGGGGGLSGGAIAGIVIASVVVVIVVIVILSMIFG